MPVDRLLRQKYAFKIVICMNRIHAFEEKEMTTRKLVWALTTMVVGFVSFMTFAGKFPTFAEDGTKSVSMLQLNLPLFLILMVGAGVVGSLAFMIVVGTDIVRRRRQRKYSCIQH